MSVIRAVDDGYIRYTIFVRNARVYIIMLYNNYYEYFIRIYSVRIIQ